MNQIKIYSPLLLLISLRIAIANESPLCWEESALIHYNDYNDEKVCKQYLQENFKLDSIKNIGKFEWQSKSSLDYGFAKEVRKDSLVVVVTAKDEYISKITAKKCFMI